MKVLSSRLVKQTPKIIAGWIRGLTKFEKLLLGLIVAPWCLFVILVAIGVLVGSILDLIGNYQFKREQEQLTARLSEITPQIQEVKLQEQELRLSDDEIMALPEFKACLEQPIDLVPGFIKASPELQQATCKLRWRKETKKVEVQKRLTCNKYATIPIGGRLPETELEKEYCQIQNQLSLKHSSQLDKLSLSSNNFEFFIKTSLVFGGLFIVVEILKYTIRAALDKNNHA